MRWECPSKGQVTAEPRAKLAMITNHPRGTVYILDDQTGVNLGDVGGLMSSRPMRVEWATGGTSWQTERKRIVAVLE